MMRKEFDLALPNNILGDFPGVCSPETLEFYSKNCPDPNLLLQIQSQSPVEMHLLSLK